MSDSAQTFDVDGKTYEIKYTIGQVKTYENMHRGRGIMATFVDNGGALSLQELIDLAACGLKVQGGGFVSIRQGQEMAENLLQENGYSSLLDAVLSAIQRDCGFFFKTEALG